MGKNSKYAVACSLIGSIISILSGYETGVMAGASLFIQEDLKLTDTQVQLLIGILNVCAFIGCLTAGHVSNYVGRRRTITVGACFFVAGSTVMSQAHNFGLLMAGRCAAGIGVGYALMIAPVYATEIAPAATRGSLAATPDVCINLGALAGYTSTYFFGKLPLAQGWRAMLGLGGLPSAVLALGVLFMPESPRWLAMHGRVEESRAVLRQLSDTPEEAELLWSKIAPVAVASPQSSAGVWKEMFLHPTPPVRRMLVAGVGILFMQHLSGINGVQLYSPRVFKDAGITSRDHILATTVFMGLAKTVFILSAILLVDRVGRRPLYLSSLAGVIVSLTCLGTTLTIIRRAEPHHAAPWTLPVAITSVFTFVASFSIGLGPITGCYSSEVLPLRLRAHGVSLGVALNRLTNAAVALTFVSLSDAITMGGAFFLYAGLATCMAAFFYFNCPETKGRPLEEIEEMFTHGWRARHQLSSLEIPVRL
ncbi:probable polyol transporter 6 [Lolium perenne]|uniref:probable polyol transporter 6 n=1 Tax=Lolium perenne TaxID=4522 RepID=UPI0021F50249|nr:probable polyol transporter 6 [Lolium perenne]